MPVTRTATRALRKSLRKQTVNVRRKKTMKTAVKSLIKTPSVKNLSEAYSQIDKAVKNNLVQKNKAARMKSSLSSQVK